jgi:pectate lyase
MSRSRPCTAQEPEMFQIVGLATVKGNTTGGAGGNKNTVSTGTDLQDLSVIGTGAGADFDSIGIKIRKVSNIIIRNLKIEGQSCPQRGNRLYQY